MSAPAAAPPKSKAQQAADALLGFLKPTAQDSASKFKTYIFDPIDFGLSRVVPETAHLAPIIFTLGTAFWSLLTLNYPLAIFSASSVEALGFYHVLNLVSTYTLSTALSAMGQPSAAENPSKCRSFFTSMTPSRFAFFFDKGVTGAFPNFPLFFISYAAAYMIQGMLFFNQETSDLGPQYSNRPYLAIIGAGLFLTLYGLYLYTYGCEGFFSILLSIVVGTVVGLLICNQNNLLFGKSAVDVLFVPPLARRTGMDYICVTTQGAK